MQSLEVSAHHFFHSAHCHPWNKTFLKGALQPCVDRAAALRNKEKILHSEVLPHLHILRYEINYKNVRGAKNIQEEESFFA